jgi:MEMO1 family protein
MARGDVFLRPSFYAIQLPVNKPKLRWVEAVPFVKDGQEMVILTDSEGIMDQSLAVSKDVVFLLSLMDGTRTLRDIQADYMRNFGTLMYLEQLEELVGKLDAHLFLDNERYAAFAAKIRDEYESAPVRASCCAGRSYPAGKMELLMFLDEMFKDNGTGQARAPQHDITGILAPHIDYPRGCQVYRETYRHLRSSVKPLLVVLVTCHHPAQKIWNISLKDFATPIDVVPCSREIAARIRTDPFLKHYVSEWPHRNEHSVELQLPLIQFNMQADFEILPIVTGSMHEYIEGRKDIDDGEITEIVQRFREVLDGYGRPCIIICGADLAHIGAQFGDRYRLDRFVLEQSRERDEAILKSIRNVDARSFFEAVRGERDERRICGLTPIYFQLRLLQGDRCTVVDYGQWSDGRSSVSFAGGVFYAS